jgi:hypothetical protein
LVGVLLAITRLGTGAIWLGWLTLTADLLFLLIYLRFWGLCLGQAFRHP